MYGKLELDGLLLCEHDVDNSTKNTSFDIYEVIDTAQSYFKIDGDNDSHFLKRTTVDRVDGSAGLFTDESYSVKFTFVLLQDNDYKVNNILPVDFLEDIVHFMGAPQLNNYDYYYMVFNQSKWLDSFYIADGVDDSGSFSVDYTKVIEKLMTVTSSSFELTIAVPFDEDNNIMMYENNSNYDIWTTSGGYFYWEYRQSNVQAFQDGVYSDTESKVYGVTNGDVYESTDLGGVYTAKYNASTIVSISLDSDDNIFLLDSVSGGKIDKFGIDFQTSETINSSLPANQTDIAAINNDKVLLSAGSSIYLVDGLTTTPIYTFDDDVTGIASHDSGRTIVAVVAETTEFKLYLSEDYGATFEKLSNQNDEEITLINGGKPRVRKGGTYVLADYETGEDNNRLFRIGI